MTQKPAAPKLIAVMGLTGTGKTSFINAIAGSQLKVSGGLRSCTKAIAMAPLQLDGHVIHLIDSPGFDDSDLSDSDILKEIGKYMKTLNDEKLHLTGLIYLLDISRVRAGNSATKNIRTFRGLVGENNMSNVILVTTRWDLVANEPESVTDERVKELESDEGFWGGMMKAGARHEKLIDVKRDGERILRGLLLKSTVELLLQTELRDGVDLFNTAAGKVVYEELKKQQEKHEEEMAGLKAELEEAKSNNEGAATISLLEGQFSQMMERNEKLLKERDEMHARVVAMKDEEIIRLRNEANNGGWCIIM